MSAHALVVGESLVDEVVEGGVVHRHPGGSPANVALGLARLGVTTVLHTMVGGDEDGQLLQRHLSASGVLLTAGSVADSPTSRAIATIAEDGSATYEFAISWNPRPVDEFGAANVIHTGSLAAFLEPGCDVVNEVLRRGRAAGALITFDPNIRPSIIRDRRDALARFIAIASRSHLTKLSDQDAEFLFPGESVEDVATTLLDLGAAVVAITRGDAGAHLGSDAARVDLPAVSTSVADTIGAGDSFMAAMIWALVECDGGWNGRAISPDRLERAGIAATTAAAITVSRTGADLPLLADLAACAPAA